MDTAGFFLVLGLSQLAVIADIWTNEGFSRKKTMKTLPNFIFVGAVPVFVFIISLSFFVLGLQFEEKDYVNLDEFFKASQLALLALVVALGAYVSSVRTKIYETMASSQPIYNSSGEQLVLKKRADPKYDNDIFRLAVVDFLLIVTGFLIIIRIILWVFSKVGVPPYPLVSLAIIGLLAVIVFYFGLLHVCQWLRI